MEEWKGKESLDGVVSHGITVIKSFSASSVVVVPPSPDAQQYDYSNHFSLSSLPSNPGRLSESFQ